MHGSGKFALASLYNLNQLPPSGAIVVAAPLKIVGGSGHDLLRPRRRICWLADRIHDAARLQEMQRAVDSLRAIHPMNKRVTDGNPNSFSE